MISVKQLLSFYSFSHWKLFDHPPIPLIYSHTLYKAPLLKIARKLLKWLSCFTSAFSLPYSKSLHGVHTCSPKSKPDYEYFWVHFLLRVSFLAITMRHFILISSSLQYNDEVQSQKNSAAGSLFKRSQNNVFRALWQLEE